MTDLALTAKLTRADTTVNESSTLVTINQELLAPPAPQETNFESATAHKLQAACSWMPLEMKITLGVAFFFSILYTIARVLPLPNCDEKCRQQASNIKIALDVVAGLLGICLGFGFVLSSKIAFNNAAEAKRKQSAVV